MCREILEPAVLAKVRAAGPQVSDTPQAEVRKVLGALQIVETETEIMMIGMDGKKYYQSLINDLAGKCPFMTPKRIGLICRGLGLDMRRLSKGYRVAWNQEQMLILGEHFELWRPDVLT